MHNEFELVKKKRQRKRKSNSKVGIPAESQNYLKKKLDNVVEEFQSSRFCFDLLQAIDNCLATINFNSIDEILCFGLGNFSESKSSIHQLAALIRLRGKYNAVVKVYDPVFTSSEVELLEKLKFQILPENEEGKRQISGCKGVLVFLPHCPKQLTNNFLWANWNRSLCKCILIANSFSRIIQDNTQKVLKESANYILKIHPKTVEISLEDSYHIENIFNDTSVHCFTPEDINEKFFLETVEQEPVYSNDIEFIRKGIEVVNIKDE